MMGGDKMPRKSTKTSNGSAAVVDILDSEGFYCIKGDLLWKYRALTAEYDNVQAQVLRNQLAIRGEIERNPTLKSLYEEKASLGNNSTVALKELQMVQTEIEKVLG